jgi:hypothetical protein
LAVKHVAGEKPGSAIIKTGYSSNLAILVKQPASNSRSGVSAGLQDEKPLEQYTSR